MNLTAIKPKSESTKCTTNREKNRHTKCGYRVTGSDFLIFPLV